MKTFSMNIDGYGTRNNGKTFEVILQAEDEDMAYEIGCAIADKYQELYPELGEEWDVVNVEEVELETEAPAAPEEMTTEKKYTNWLVWTTKGKVNLPTLVPMTTEQALEHFKADAVQGLDKEYVDHFGHYVNEAEARCS